MLYCFAHDRHHKANEEAQAVYYTVIKHSGHLRTLEKCKRHSPAARVLYICLVFSNAHRVLSKCHTRLGLLYLFNKSRAKAAWAETLLIIWQAPRAGKMNQILRCDWLPERAGWIPLRSGIPAASRKKKFPESHIINPLLTKCEVKMAGNCLRSFFACLWTDNSANIQPS